MGYWTYHKTRRGSYCCGPWCAMALLAIPLLPVLNGFFIVKDKLSASEQTAYIETVSSEKIAENDGTDL